MNDEHGGEGLTNEMTESKLCGGLGKLPAQTTGYVQQHLSNRTSIFLMTLK
jgi:hypothetical protein